MRRKESGVLPLLLLAVFAGCLFLVLTLGADSYTRLTDRDSRAFDRRTAVQYLATKVRQADTAGMVSAGDFQGCDALILAEDIDGEWYVTRIYCYEGALRELFSAENSGLLPSDGEQVLPASSLRVSSSDGRTLTMELTDAAGETTSLVLTLRSGEGGAS